MRQIREDLLSRLKVLGIDKSELVELRARSSGPGGQHVNKVETSVRVRHSPTKLEGCASEHRSLYLNRQLAVERLLEHIEALREAKKQEQSRKRFLRRHSKQRRPKHIAEAIVQEKRHRSFQKRLRKGAIRED